MGDAHRSDRPATWAPSMTYGIHFDGATSAEALRQALHDVYDVPLDLVYIGPYDRLNEWPGPDPIALITPADGPFADELTAGEKLEELTKAGELDLARTICRAAHTRALLDDGSPAGRAATRLGTDVARPRCP